MARTTPVPTVAPRPTTVAPRPSAAPVPAAPPTTAGAATTATPATPAPPTTGAALRSFLGVTVEESADGPLVVDVFPGSGAAGAAIVPGDVITAVDATAVATIDELGTAILAHDPGDTVTVTLSRNGGTTTVRATLGSR